MAHQGGTMNLVIHDPSGNPQVIKVQKGPASKTLAKPESIKLLTSKPGQVQQLLNANPGSIIPGTALRTLTIQSQQRYVTVPVTPQLQSLIRKQNASQSASASAQQPKTIQLPTQSMLVPAEEESSPSSRKRKESENGAEYPSDYSGNKRRKSDKGGKGLRHFSMKVCEKVRKKGTTTYNEVADELVAEFTNPTLIPNSVDQQYDQKNIRRRVYDALNVLMAMNIIAKEKKEIRWLGLPTTSAQECSSLIKEKEQITERIQAKTQQLYELMLQQISYKNLVQRNFEMEKNRGQPQPNSVIHLPFIVVNSDRKTVIDCSITNDKTEYHFVFNDKFQIHDDFEILKQIGLTDGLENGTVTEQNLAKIKSMLPKPMEKYISQLALEGVQNNMKKEDNLELDEFAQDDCAGTSTEIFHTEDVDSPEETSDEESNISADLEHV